MKLRNIHNNLLVKQSAIFSVWGRKWGSFVMEMGCGCEPSSKVCKATSLVLFSKNKSVKWMKSWARQFLLCFEALHGCCGVKMAVKPLSWSDFISSDTNLGLLWKWFSSMTTSRFNQHAGRNQLTNHIQFVKLLNLGVTNGTFSNCGKDTSLYR